ncbi:hypothetical protein NC652_033227 [Populus alba x Populus x berolinensis]|nr:hypothetical protein NC652_033227 [Populus alba x Populus x berolinensis]
MCFQCTHDDNLNTPDYDPSSSWSLLDTERDYSRWVSWNVNNHQKRAMLVAKSTVQTPGADGKLVLDGKLRQAEMNSVRVTVSQDGTGDFKTITEAIYSIPPYNTRRVIIAIKPGDSSEPPTITGNDTASVSGKDGKPLRTYQSATVAVDANYFVAINMKFEVRAKSHDQNRLD